MTTHAELRRLAEAAANSPKRYTDASFIAAADPQTVLALLDAAERADRAIGLVREGRSIRFGGHAPDLQARADSFLAEVDRAG